MNISIFVVAASLFSFRQQNEEMAGPGANEDPVDLHDLCIDGDYAGLKSALESSTNVNVNQYKLFVYRPLPHSSKRADGLIDGEDDYQSDDDSSDSGSMFDYRSPLFYAIIHDRLACVKLLIEHGANTDKLR
jgi:ankyrin repeat protein